MNCRYELFTSTLSTDNLRLYESVGCGGFDFFKNDFQKLCYNSMHTVNDR